MKRILIVAPSMMSAGGVEKLVDSLSRLFSGSYEVYIASFDPLGSKPYFQNDVPFHPLGGEKRFPLFFRFVTYIAAARRLSQLKRALRANLTISVLWRADLINILSRVQDATISLAVINILDNETNRLLVRLRSIVGYIYRRFDRILVIAPEIMSEYRQLYKIDAEKIDLFKTFLARPSEAPYYYDDKPRFVACARIVREKNIEGLLHAFERYGARHPGHQLVIIGDGPLLEDIKSLALRLKLTYATQPDSDAQVLFVGAVAKPEVFMVNARGFLLTSRHEGVPTVVILAASLGLPILAADCHGGGMRLLFNLSPDEPLDSLSAADGVAAGRLLPIPEPGQPDTLDAWAQAMEQAHLDPVRRQQWVDGALELGASRSPEAVRQHWIAAIDSVLAS
jgi:glycosyltransferase involved in cell wall biosynthesis